MPQAQVIPWAVSESNWVVGGSVRLEPSRTVFVGALHGMLTAPALATIMNDLFSGVVYAGNQNYTKNLVRESTSESRLCDLRTL